MEASHTVVDVLRLVVYGGLAVAAIRTWRRGRDVAGAWVAATFVVLAAVVIAGDRLPSHSDAAAVDWGRKLLVGGLLLFPYFLYRFAVSFDDRRSWVNVVADALTVGVVGVALLGPRFPEEGETEPAWLAFYVVAVVVQWTFLSGLAGYRLWHAGNGEAVVPRRRMRLMALGSLVLNVGLLVVAAGSSSSASTQDSLEVSSQVLGFVAAGLFYLGFDPPGFLRVLWRQPDVVPLREAEAGLMSAVSAREVADVVLPYATRLLGGKGAVLADRQGRVVAVHNLPGNEAAALARLVAREPGLEPVARHDLLAVPLRRLWLAVQSSRYAPFFGREEIELLRGLAFFAELALDRADLFEQERTSRQQAELANAELETFVYSVSHDLKSPLVSLVGFLDYLRADLGEVEGEVAFYLDRMDAGVHYMDALIHDLLELSRIGRVQRDAADVDLGRVVREVADELVPGHGAASVDVQDLPVLHINPLRARQLFTNLIGNALLHAGRGDVHVRIACEELLSGGVRLTVADDGKGIPVEYREKVFKVFERLERSNQDTGTGIGLAVCRKIVEQAGGVIRVGEGAAAGAAFELDFPAAVVRGPGARLEGAR